MIPIHDSVRSRSFPVVNVTIIAVNVAVFLYEVMLSQDRVGLRTTALDTFIFHWGNIPACTLDALGRSVAEAQSRVCGIQPDPRWTFITAMFMHGGWLHLLGNMLFLWIFGDNVEDAMGHLRYALFYLLVGALAAFTHMLVRPGDLTPAIGASGAIAGVMGAYIVLYPRAVIVILLLFVIPLPVPAFLLIGFWFVSQLLSGYASLGPETVGASGGVAYFAHIGGFVAGALLIKFFVLGRRRRGSGAMQVPRSVL